MISISIVSHGQSELVKHLLNDLDAVVPSGIILEVIITCNIPEITNYSFNNAPLRFINNQTPKGYAKNHNAAFEQSEGDFFCVLNPDIRLIENPFEKLLGEINSLKLAMIAPTIVDASGRVEDSARKFPTISRLLKRLLIGKHDIYPFSKTNKVFYPDWVGGMFMLFDKEAYHKVKGFDERYFLYYEDVDLCVRLWKKGLIFAVSRQVKVIHHAQMQSHKDLVYFRWHIISMIRFFIMYYGRLPKNLKNP